ncbi:MAG: hypothetical protein HQK49_05675 [Oligoflexia bacterium]|nr:hypothetical protein [Oligoflexia bacterium]
MKFLILIRTGMIITLSFINIIFSISSFANVVIVISDLDDTIKKSNVMNTREMVIRHLWGNVEPFDKLIAIYQNIKTYYEKKGDDVRFFYLSLSPSMLNVSDWLLENDVPDASKEGTIRQRSIKEMFENKCNFKIRALKEFIQETISNLTSVDSLDVDIRDRNVDGCLGSESDKKERSKIKVLFFGDNAEYDQEAYKSVVSDVELDLKNKKVETEIFIRKVDAKKPEMLGINYFTSEMDLLNNKILKDVIDGKLKEAIIKDFEDGVLIPEYIPH